MSSNLHNISIEQCVLMSLMTVQNSLEVVANDLTQDCFYAERHQQIFKAIQMLAEENNPYDLLLVEQKLTEQKALERVGGSEYLIQLMSESASSFYNLETYVAELNKLKSHRELEAMGQKFIALAQDLTHSDVFIEAESLLGHNDNKDPQKNGVTFSEAIESSIKRMMEKLNAKENDFIGVRFNLEHLDKKLGVIEQGHLCVIGGRPGSGKSTLAQMLAIDTSLTFNKAVLFVSAEMDRETLVDRCISALGDIPYSSIRNGELYDGMLKQFADTKQAYENLPIFIEDKQQPTIAEVRSFARKAQRRYKGLGCIIIDYIGLIRDPSAKDRIQEVASVSRKLKAMAKEFKCPVIVLAQLNRDSASSKGRPRSHNLKESGQIEQDADQIILVHPLLGDQDQMPTGVTELIIDKNRHGQKGVIRVLDRLEICRFSTAGAQVFDDLKQSSKR